MRYLTEADMFFTELFDGNPDVYGTELGGCVRNPLREGVTAHLEDGIPCGTYPVYGGWVTWGCVDLDLKTDKKPSGDYPTEEECDRAADRLSCALEYFQCPTAKERTRSYGRHIWLFTEEPVPSFVMRRALYVACKLADVTTREINPKQEQLTGDSIGNYVRLPYPHRAADEGGGRIFLNQNEPLTYEQGIRSVRYADIQALALLASYYSEKPQRKHHHYSSTYQSDSRTANNLIAWSQRIIPEDRSAALWWVANTLRNENMPIGEAEQVLTECCKIWGKHSGREQSEITRLIRKVYG